ncbi:hypothetical protein [Nocardiopsis coralliicola]
MNGILGIDAWGSVISVADFMALAAMAATALITLVNWSGVFHDLSAKSGWDLKKRREAEIARVVGETLPKQIGLLRTKEDVVAEIVESVRTESASEQRAQKMARAFERIDAIDRAATEINARVEARREQIEHEFAELIDQRYSEARALIARRCVALVCGGAGAVLLGIWLF